MKLKKYLVLVLLFLLGFLLRVYFVDKVVVGDLLSFGEWGETVVKRGPTNFYFGDHVWYYSAPNYLPLSQIFFGGAFWLFDHKYVLAQLHNLVRFPPAAFIIYFYQWGYILLLKLPSILADLGLGILVYKLIQDFTGDVRKAAIGMALFVLNPITIFISGGWGQTDSLVTLFGFLSFVLLVKKKFVLSSIFLFISLYQKPGWAIFVPFFIFLMFLVRPKIKSIILGLVLTFTAFVLVTKPFSDGNIFSYTYKLVTVRTIQPLRVIGKASVSAFNFQTIFFKIDRDFPSATLLGVRSRDIGILAYLFINLYVFSYVKKVKNFLWGVVFGLFVIGLGSFLFLANMLERYFFPGLAPLVVIMMVAPKTFVKGVLLNIILFANIIWAFYRRGSDEIDHPFTGNNFLLIRVLSLVNVVSFVLIIRKLKQSVLQLNNGGLPHKRG